MSVPHTSAENRTVLLADPAATEALAAELAAGLGRGDVIALTGDLGAGKTVFARALIMALGKAAGIEIGHVPSPTFTLVQLYDLADFTLYHFDLYRLATADEVWETGIEDAFADGVSVIEWADRIDGLLPARSMHVDLAFGVGETDRLATISGGA
jgi:tRNA threonylcarbamoyladenosine biosynthesis protein TsaE